MVCRNEIFARHCLASRSQQVSETVGEYLQALKQLSKDCVFKPVPSEQYKNEYIREAFIRGLKCARIRERLLENTTISLNDAFDQARAMKFAERKSAFYLTTPTPVHTAAVEFFEEVPSQEHIAAASLRSGNCFFCGNIYKTSAQPEMRSAVNATRKDITRRCVNQNVIQARRLPSHIR